MPGEIRTEDAAKLVSALDQSSTELLSALRSVPQEWLSHKPSPECWSALEVVEHVSLVDRLFAKRIASSPVQPESVFTPEREKLISEGIPLRTVPITAPEVSHPKGRFATVEEATDGFQKARAHIVQVLTERQDQLRFMQVQHPILGALSGYEAFLLAAAHARRHAAQIRDISASKLMIV